jgi:flagellin
MQVKKITINISQNFAAGCTLSTIGISAASAAENAIGNIDDALAIVNSTRADLGAKQNRFASIIRSNENASQNLSASRSRVEDTDYAAESAALARSSVLQQASSSMLAQANQQPQIALSLL